MGGGKKVLIPWGDSEAGESMASGLSGSDMSRRKRLIAVAIAAVLIAVVAVAYVMMTDSSDSGGNPSSVTLLITHYNPTYGDPARVAVYIDDVYLQNASIDVGANYTVVFDLAQGDHVIGFDFTIAPSAEPDGVIDAEYQVEITSSDPSMFSWEVGSGFAQAEE